MSNIKRLKDERFFKSETPLLSIDIEKSLNSVNRSFLLTILANYGFNQDFLKWISILLLNQEPCVINGGITTQHFRLKHGTRQRHPISVFFILLLEIAFIFIQKAKTFKVC